MSGTPPRPGIGWATAAFTLGIIVSIAANVAHTWHPSPAVLQLVAARGGDPAHWSPEVGAMLAAAFYPVALLLTVELQARIPWPQTKSWAAARYGGLSVVAAVAAIVSYRHMSGLLAAYGEDSVTARLGPLAVDGLMVVASMGLLATGLVGHGGHLADPGPLDTDEDDDLPGTRPERLAWAREYLVSHPDASGAEIGRQLGISERTGLRIRDEVMADLAAIAGEIDDSFAKV